MNNKPKKVSRPDSNISSQKFFNPKAYRIPTNISRTVSRITIHNAIRRWNQQHYFNDHINNFMNRFVLVIFLLFQPSYHC